MNLGPIFNLLNKLDGTRTLSSVAEEFINTYEPQDVRTASTLEDILTDQVKHISNNVLDTLFNTDYEQAPFTISKILSTALFSDINSELPKNYKTVNIENYEFILQNLEKLYKNTTLEFAYSNMNYLKKDRAKLSFAERQFKKIGMKSIDKKTLAKHPIESLRNDEVIKEAVEAYIEIKEGVNYLEKENTIILTSSNVCNNLISEFRKNLLFIKDLRAKDLPSSEEEVDAELAKLIRGDINRSRVLKNLQTIPQKEITPIKSETANNQTQTFTQKPSFKENKAYNSSHLEFLTERGFKSQKAKEILDSVKMDDIKEFILGIENTFRNYGLKSRDAQILFENNSEILNLKNGHKLDYIKSLEMLFDFVNPTKVSGILPKYNPSMYASTSSIQEFIKKMNQESKISTVNLDIITDEKDKNYYLSMIKNNTPIFGEFLEKWQSKGFNKQKTPMYKAYSEEFGEGQFRKVKHGSARSVYKIENDGSGNYTLLLCTYFKNHTEYDKFYKK
ncbi:hypothetical protein COV13_04350 [Candidatus Woesearchaeota archaeon CG10_big_fil_rev_8_21_14_0_10_32_9]|nr:MAG: hypothetical protein COV13_04350 [Candidatus Woesearchaeota archaeon CG10_big_fil_rev_8_21_14_0_10_32_9]